MLAVVDFYSPGPVTGAVTRMDRRQLSINDELADLSKYRIRGEPVPDDLKAIWRNRRAFYDRMELSLSLDPNWEPWADISYLTEKELVNPEIAANVAAMAKVMDHISFVAQAENHEYYGYWRGPSQRLVANSPVVWLDNEGQFHLCAGRNLIDALTEPYSADPEDFLVWKSWLASLGIELPYDTTDELADPDDDVTPDMMHDQLYHKFLDEARVTSSHAKSWWRFW